MKIQTRILLLTAFLVTLISVVVLNLTLKLEQSAVSFQSERFIEDNYFRLYIPEGFSDVIKRTEGGWDIQEFRLKKDGYFQFAKSTSENPDFQSLCKRYFNMTIDPKDTPILFRSSEGLTFFKHATVIENGAYVMKKTGKRSQVICFFTINNSLYWLMLSTRSSLDSYRQLFNTIIEHIEFHGDISISDQFSKASEDSLLESYFLFYQPIYLFVILPLPIMLLVFLILSAISKRMGSLPSDSEFTDRMIYAQPDIEFAIKSSLQFQIFQGALGISNSALTVFKFRKPFIIIPLNYLKQYSAEIKSGFLGTSYIKIKAEASHTVKARHPVFSKSFEIRIYTQDPVTVLSFIQ